MTIDEIRNLGTLARIALSDEEAATLNQEIDSILAYVSAVTTMAGEPATTHQVGARINVLRSDVITNTPGEYRKRMLAAMPKTDGDYLVVKKILNVTQ
ncbi:MAG: Asp-tRNA(Asn)/Glu-tRNA(Gln) amidotransferase subunit GatC [Patescibacteria group bacterium]